MRTIEELETAVKEHLAAHETLEDFLFDYDGSDWKEFITFDEKSYTRKIISETQDFEIVLVGWSPNQQSPKHTHPSRGCSMKILQGILLEQRFGRRKDIVEYVEGDSSYIHDDLYKHILSSNTQAVSLHIYAPARYKP